MPSTFEWFAADRRGRLALFHAERWGLVPKHATPLHEGERGEAVVRALHAAWVTKVGPLQVFEHHDLSAVPESAAPHLVAFARTPPALPGAVRIGERVALFRVVPDELRELLALDEDAEDRLIVGSLAIDEDSFGERRGRVFPSFKRWGDDPRYLRVPTETPFSLARDALGDLSMVVLDTSFAEESIVDLEALLPPDQLYLRGR